jgi:hypothetical protein
MTRAFRAVLFVAAAVLVAVTAVHAWPSGRGAVGETDGGAAAPSADAIVEDQSVLLDVDPGGSDVHGRMDAGWRRVARGFASDFASYDGDHAAWHHRISQWTTPSLAEAYRHADMRLLPIGPPTSLEVVAEGLGVVEVVVGFPMASTTVVRLESTTRENWAVAAVEPG